MKIAIVGAGYVGLALATLFSKRHAVVLVDIDQIKVKQINNRISPIKDAEIELCFKTEVLNLSATLDLASAIKDARYVVIATPTNYDEEKNNFDTTSVESIIAQSLTINPDAQIVIKSTIPVGFVLSMRAKYQCNNIFFSPEFLREGRALYDNLYPSRIIVGDNSQSAITFANLLLEGAINQDVKVLYTSPTEAEAIKLFANTYLAMRVTFFNELDTYAEIRGLSSKDIIDGVGLDPRIGTHYNNPSFGYGGYCLPKDTRQLLANFEDVPNNIIKAVVEGNMTRKEHIVKMIMAKKPHTVGIYRFTVKKGSDNLKHSTMHEIAEMLIDSGIKVIVYEPLITNSNKLIQVENNLTVFKTISDIIVANRLDDNLSDVVAKVYTRDIYHQD